MTLASMVLFAFFVSNASDIGDGGGSSNCTAAIAWGFSGGSAHSSPWSCSVRIASVSKSRWGVLGPNLSGLSVPSRFRSVVVLGVGRASVLVGLDSWVVTPVSVVGGSIDPSWCWSGVSSPRVRDQTWSVAKCGIVGLSVVSLSCWARAWIRLTIRCSTFPGGRVSPRSRSVPAGSHTAWGPSGPPSMILRTEHPFSIRVVQLLSHTSPTSWAGNSLPIFIPRRRMTS